MKWSDGFSARYYATIVDPVTWRDVEALDILSGSIKLGDETLIESANLDVRDYDASTERWIRVWLDARQNGDSYHGPMFTGLATSPSLSIEGTAYKRGLTCYSVLKPADDILLPRGWYVGAGASGAGTIQELLETIPAPIEIEEDSPRLQNTIVAEDGETRLTMANKILSAINWRFRIEGDGTINVCHKVIDDSDRIQTLPVATFDSLDYDSLEMTLTVKNDWFSCPNVFRAVEGGVMAVARDDDENSLLSTVNRGREIWKEETSCLLKDGETVAQYAERRLYEEQMKHYELSYTRRYHPDVRVTDLIRIHYPAQGIDGYFYVSSQSINLGFGASLSETVRKV